MERLSASHHSQSTHRLDSVHWNGIEVKVVNVSRELVFWSWSVLVCRAGVGGLTSVQSENEKDPLVPGVRNYSILSRCISLLAVKFRRGSWYVTSWRLKHSVFTCHLKGRWARSYYEWEGSYSCSMEEQEIRRHGARDRGKLSSLSYEHDSTLDFMLIQLKSPGLINSSSTCQTGQCWSTGNQDCFCVALLSPQMSIDLSVMLSFKI